MKAFYVVSERKPEKEFWFGEDLNPRPPKCRCSALYMMSQQANLELVILLVRRTLTINDG